ncbi:MAG: SUMF1/EgtB/PvdO family nonheme iron enzyme, partial [Bryobacteraceae bacterium]|nr:SUMF1/EgtB/PvdO family nonheme iron enzyme [Bryobacteraceae bacterium]
KKQGPSREPAASRILENSLIDIPAGFATLGRKKEEGFGWDNEFEEHKVHVPAFRIRRHKVANGEYLQFVNAGGEAPFYWTRRGGEWHYRGMFDEIPLPHEWPVYVTFQQAVESSRWKGVSLPTEAQWHRAAFGTAAGEERLYPWGEAPPDASRGNFDFDRWDPVPVDANPCGESAFGVQQAVGNGWEWTSTVFGPFPGFSPRSYYPGYSANFFDGQHYVLKGGSPRTAAALLRRSFRNWFRPRYPYIYATFRCVEE